MLNEENEREREKLETGKGRGSESERAYRKGEKQIHRSLKKTKTQRKRG